MIRALSGFMLALVACSPAPAPAPEAPPAPVAEPATPIDLKALEAAHDWQKGEGATLNADWDTGVKAQLGKMSRQDAIAAIQGSGFECIYGEAHADYPDPAAQCTRSFATRACQMDWEIFSTAKNAMVDEVDGTFTRDCVGVDRDWPEPVKSVIDDQLTPATPPIAPS